MPPAPHRACAMSTPIACPAGIARVRCLPWLDVVLDRIGELGKFHWFTLLSGTFACALMERCGCRPTCRRSPFPGRKSSATDLTGARARRRGRCSCSAGSARRADQQQRGGQRGRSRAAAGRDGRLAPAGGLRPHCCVPLLGLIACTGLRIGEALSLTCGDVDLSEGLHGPTSSQRR